MEWNTLQSKVHGIDLNKFISNEFMDKLKKEFDDKDVDIVTIQIAVRDRVKNLNDDAKLDVISLSNKNIEDTLLNNTVVDVNSEENFGKIRKILDD